MTRIGPVETIRFEQCIIAAGSEAARLPFLPADPRIIDSTGALELPPASGAHAGDRGRHHRAGDGLRLRGARGQDRCRGAHRPAACPAAMPTWCDRSRSASARATDRSCSTRVSAPCAPRPRGCRWIFRARPPAAPQYDHVLVAVGRVPNGRRIEAQRAGVHVDERGFIATDKQMRTNVPHIFAIGDIAGQPMLAHKATHEGKVAAEVAAGHKSSLRCARDSGGGVYGPGGRLGRAHRDRGQGAGHRRGAQQLPVGRQRPLAVARAR